MIRFEFQTKDASGSQSESSILPGMSVEVIEQTCFNLPVRLKVGDVDLFENISPDRTVFVCHVERDMLDGSETSEDSDLWITVPLLHLATVGLRQVRKACLGEPVFYHLPGGGHLRLRPSGEKVEVISSLNGRSETVNCSELLAAFEDFSDRVRQFIQREAAELQEHPAWHTWFDDTCLP